MKNFLHNTWKHRAHIVMALPGISCIAVLCLHPDGWSGNGIQVI